MRHMSPNRDIGCSSPNRVQDPHSPGLWVFAWLTSQPPSSRSVTNTVSRTATLLRCATSDRLCQTCESPRKVASTSKTGLLRRSSMNKVTKEKNTPSDDDRYYRDQRRQLAEEDPDWTRFVFDGYYDDDYDYEACTICGPVGTIGFLKDVPVRVGCGGHPDKPHRFVGLKKA